MTQTPIDRLRELRVQAQAGGGPDRIAAHRAKGKLTARERIELLLDKGSFKEVDAFVTNRAAGFGLEKQKTLTDGVITGWGTIRGRLVYVFAQDFTVLGGSVGEAHAGKITKIQDMALKNGAPIIGINDSGGARIQEGMFSLVGYSEIFLRNTMSSGVIPQLSAIMGPCAGGAVYSPALTDFVFMTNNSYMFITGPDVVRSVMQENVSFEELGGGMMHSAESGVCHFLTTDDRDCLARVRTLLSYLPGNNQDDPPYIKPMDDPERRCPELKEIVPTDPYKAYDVRGVIGSVVDDGVFFEVHQLWAENMVVGFARLNGYVVGIVANQPMVLAGCIDIKASIKATHFIRICDAYNVPIITLQDVPGFLPGKEQEYGGIIRNGARMIYAYSEATVPKLMVILRKSYGGAYCVMSSKGLRGDLLYAWPNAEIAVMGAEGAVNILFKKQVSDAEDPNAKRKELVDDYEDKFNNPYVAASRGLIDDVIEPRDSRRVLIRALELTLSKRERHVPKKHGISPM